MTISRWFLLIMRTVSNKKNCRENQNTHFMFSDVFQKSCLLWYVEKCGGARGATNYVTIWRIRVACWINKATHAQALTHADKYVIFITFSRQPLLRERASMLRSTYTVCLFPYSAAWTRLRYLARFFAWIVSCLVAACLSFVCPTAAWSNKKTWPHFGMKRFYGHSNFIEWGITFY